MDSSCYAIPSPTAVAKWVAAVPPGFKFHFKAFGLFPSRGSAVAQLPREAKELLHNSNHTSRAPGMTRPGPQAGAHGAYIRLEQMPPAAVQTCWDLFHACLQPVIQVCARLVHHSSTSYDL